MRQEQHMQGVLKEICNNRGKLDGCIVWNAHNTVLGEEALLIHIVPVGYAT